MTNGNAELEAPHGDGGVVGWTFLTNHAHVLLAIARDPHLTMRKVAVGVGITERATQKIVSDLVAAGYLTKTRTGRRNSYIVATGRPFRHPLTAGHDLDELLAVLVLDRRTNIR
jgi:predicted transcriptional regulator